MSLEIKRSAQRPQVVVLVGELDIYTVAEFLDALVPVAQGGDSLTLDLREVDLIDSSGLAALMRVSRALGPVARRLHIAPTPELVRLLQVTRLTEYFDLVDSVPEGDRPTGVASDDATTAQEASQ